MKRHIQDFRRFGLNESTETGPFVSGYAYVYGEEFVDSVGIYDTYEQAKQALVEDIMSLGSMEPDEQESGIDTAPMVDQGIAFIYKQNMNEALVRVDTMGGTYGEVILAGSGKRLFYVELGEEGFRGALDRLTSGA